MARAARRRAGWRGPSVSWLLAGVSIIVFVAPILGVLVLQVFQTHLVRQTEMSLIAQSVLIGEAWRDRWLEELGTEPEQAADVKPPSARDERYAPIDPRLNLGAKVLPPLDDPTRYAQERDGPKWRAGERVMPVLQRSKLFNLSSARVLDGKGCVVAATGTWLGACFDHLPEVEKALEGTYASTARRRVSDSPTPPIESISRGGDTRVFTATPVFSAGEVVGVVWMSRTSMAPYKVAWLYRRPLLLGLVTSFLLASLLSLFMARAISKPLRQITRAAESVSRGGSSAGLEPEGFAPSEVHVLGEALSTMTAQLSGKAEYIAEFAANVSHELKSPITAIRGAAELLREELDQMPAAQRERFLANIESDASRMERLVTRLLELARIQSSPEEAGEIRLATFLANIAVSYGDQVVLDASGAPESIQMNPDHLESAVRNLLDNALRHGGGKPIDLVVRSDSGRAAISVTDRGPGVREKNRSLIFDRFFTTERDSGGTGIGLAIVKAVAETRGGEVTLETGPEGSTFTLVV
ncbi:MAG: HAMP domain-containing protein [Deltaproteobacteria bacterium]|nr:HAMP domain-containing protein [Deltaproteobacteria bacterium]